MTYNAEIQKLYIAYFSGGNGEDHHVATLLRENGYKVAILKPTHTQTTVEILRYAQLVSPHVAVDRHYGPDAKQARRDQIRRNGGKR